MTSATITQPDHDLRSRIVDAARVLFFDHGYSKISASEIAQAVGISKKTLYREFETKEDILRAVVLPKLKESSKQIDSILADRSMPFLDKLKAVMSMIGFQHQRVSPVLSRDVFVHAPEVWQEIHEVKQARFRKFGTLIEEGIKRGVFRSDVPAEVILRSYTAAVESLMVPQTLGELPCTAQEAFQSLIKILFEGILEDDSRKKSTKTSAQRMTDHSTRARKKIPVSTKRLSTTHR
ncbi:MAG TPA: TetR/AcrR family transcriptional regulator [Candidatus Kapabacteria bacterium]|nr:TetR/AcrR family transcriptional regulator [Candidatus Kapabacteria bacterium]